MPYDIVSNLPWAQISGPCAAAEDALARLDETLLRSPIREGWISRTHFTDAAASLWLDGELVTLEDLVLHDARKNIRTPTHELTRAHDVLRTRRQIFAADPNWALSAAGLDVLRGRPQSKKHRQGGSSEIISESIPPERALLDRDVVFSDDHIYDDMLADELAAIDALIKRSDGVLAGRVAASHDPELQNFMLYDLDWDEDGRLTKWRSVIQRTDALPPVLATAVAAQAWIDLEPLQRSGWLGSPIIASILRARQKTRSHLFGLNAGLKLIPREKRLSRDFTTRLLATIDAIRVGAETGLKEHDRWLLARALLQRKLIGHRSSSKLPALIDLVMARPLVSTGVIAATLRVTPRAAQDMVANLGLREATGRGRYRAWGIL